MQAVALFQRAKSSRLQMDRQFVEPRARARAHTPSLQACICNVSLLYTTQVYVFGGAPSEPQSKFQCGLWLSISSNFRMDKFADEAIQFFASRAYEVGKDRHHYMREGQSKHLFPKTPKFHGPLVRTPNCVAALGLNLDHCFGDECGGSTVQGRS